MHKIRLTPEVPFFNYLPITVFDMTEGTPRKRCKIRAEYAKVDVENLIAKGMDFEKAMAHYEDWLYNVIKIYIADDWQYESGQDEVMKIIADHVRPYYENGI
ncbi:MAG: hypothetical protein MJ146_00750 [Clostridia bacterium]|nr:hypothetical protein [Clostridia bacterium]